MIWYLSISSFKGLVPGASHFRGRITARSENKVVDVERTMTTKERIRENRREGWTLYAEGATTCAFDSEDELKEAARLAFAGFAAPSDILLCGQSYVIDPQEPLAGPEDFLDRARRIYDEWEKIDGWGPRQRPASSLLEIRAKRLSEEWENLVRSAIPEGEDLANA